MNYIDKNALVHESVAMGIGCFVWAFSQIREKVVLGDNVIVGKGVYIGPGVKIGSNVKIQNEAQIYEPAMIEDGVFVGPGTILTNDKNPRSVNEDFSIKSESDWLKTGVTLKTGASLGAGVVCVAPVIVGSWSMVGAGSLVVKDIPDGKLAYGSPARIICEVDKSGKRRID
jgi:acetyltransferase-like isoleucine patch superfamily enzyme